MLRKGLAALGILGVLGGGVTAQTLDYGPLLARGVDPDTMYFKWGFGAAASSTLYYRKVGASTFEVLSSPSSVDHELKVYGLQADSAYEYYVSYGAAQTATRGFTTCPTGGLPLDVVVLGDSRDGGTRAKTIMDMVGLEAPDLILETGDIASDGAYGTYLTQFVDIASSVVDTIPFMASPGNHDASSTLKTNYGRIFAVPRDASEAWRSYYSFVCGNVRFIGLDSNSVSSTTQIDFLTNELTAASADPAIDHVFVYFHHSPYSTGSHGDNTTVQTNWVPLFEAAGSKVRLVFTGHDHIYARLGDGSDVTYVVTGGAGAPKYSVGGATDATVLTSLSTYNYVKLHIVGGLIDGTAIDSTGATIDTFSIGMATAPPDMAQPDVPDLSSPPSGGKPDLRKPGGSTTSDAAEPTADVDMTSDSTHAQKLASGCSVGGKASPDGSDGALALLLGGLLGTALLRRRQFQ